MPVGAAKSAFELLDDLAVTSYRAVEPLQVAVHHQHKVVEALAGGDVDGAEHLRLVRFAIANEGPDLAAVLGLEAPMLQILGEARLIDGARRR